MTEFSLVTFICSQPVKKANTVTVVERDIDSFLRGADGFELLRIRYHLDKSCTLSYRRVPKNYRDRRAQESKVIKSKGTWKMVATKDTHTFSIVTDFSPLPS